jgi:hypothetical protein
MSKTNMKGEQVMKQFYLKYFKVVFSRARLVAAVAAVLLLAAAMLPRASVAGVEFVTTIGTCFKVDTISDGLDLSLQAGNDMQFEVWGFGVDLVDMRMTVDNNNDTSVTARIIRRHNGAENLLRGCRQATGSVEVEVDSSVTAGAIRERSLWFGDSRLQMRVVPFQTPVWTFVDLQQNPAACLTKNIGTVVRDLDNSRMTITLPPGASTDTTNCALTFRTSVAPADRPEIDIQRPFNYNVTGVAIMTLISGSNTAAGALSTQSIRFTGNVANIRGTTAVRSSWLTAATPNPNKTDTLNVVINPPPATNAFMQAAKCYNTVTGTTINVNDAFQCELKLSQTPPAAGQIITFEVIDRLCVAAGANTVTYSSATGIGTYTAPNSGTIHQIPLRALGGNTSVNTPCANRISPVAHTLKFWVGLRDTESGPDFTQTQINIRSPQ